MDQWRAWLKQPYGKRLKKLHAWNAGLVLLLAITGVILYIPELRGPIASFRVGLKNVHIVLGLVSILILILYLPLLGRHIKQISGKLNQQFNLWFVLFLLVGWSLSGIILWQFRAVPEAYSSAALVWHGVLTLIGIPWAIYHSISRSRWLKKDEQKRKKEKKQEQEQDSETDKDSAQSWFQNPPISRRSFVRLVTGAVLFFGLGPLLYRWFLRIFDTGGTTLKNALENDANQMIPQPVPVADLNPPMGGGNQGNFRVYTVTEIPSFTSDTWKFTISGLVSSPITLVWEDFLKLPRTVQVSDFHCVTGWSVTNVTWEGVRLSQILEKVDIDPNAKYVKFYSGDGVYTDALSMEQARMEDVMLPILLDGKPLPQDLGGPVRLVVPAMYAYKSVKWLQAIELIEEDHIGYWQMRGYETDAWLPGKL